LASLSFSVFLSSFCFSLASALSSLLWSTV
jgi:hypothetical protein